MALDVPEDIDANDDTKLARQSIFSVINEECNSQKNEGLSLGEEILILSECIHRARSAWISSKGNRGLDEIRRVASIAVRCMENHGVPARVHRDISVMPKRRKRF